MITFRDTVEDAAKIEYIRQYLMLVMGRDRVPPVADAIRYALKLAADAVAPIVEGRSR